jgi:hypothetical protein
MTKRAAPDPAPRPRARPLVALLLILAAVAAAPAPATAQAFPPGGQLPELAEVLRREGTYVGPHVRQQVTLDVEERLQQAITRAELGGVMLRFAILDRVPAGYRDLDEFADALMALLQPRDGVLVVATPESVTVRSDRLTAGEVVPILEVAQAALTSGALEPALLAAADAGVARVAELVTPVPLPTAPSLPTASRTPEGHGEPSLLSLLLPGLLLLVLSAGLYGWSSRRRWREVLGSLEGVQTEATRRATASAAEPASVAAARHRLAIGERALAALRTAPWWQTWLWPWLPPRQLVLAERAFAESLRLLEPSGPSTEPARPVEGAPYREAPAPPPEPPRGQAVSPAPPAPGGPARPFETPPRPKMPAARAVGPPAPPPRQPSRGGLPWWPRRGASAEPEPTASLDPERVLKGLAPQEPIGCFFCGHPLQPRDAQVGTVPLAGRPLRPLLCPQHARALAAGERPGVRARRVGERAVPWFQDPTYQPAWDFDPTATTPLLSWDALPSPAHLLEPSPRVIVHADDPRWPAARGDG